MSNQELASRIKGCLYAGAIGDCIGGYFENQAEQVISHFDFKWQISDDTQLTLATCEAITRAGKAAPAIIAAHFLTWYNKGMLTGLGSSTLTALKGLQVGGHWALVGRQGEYAAGNGAAMRIAPLAFINTDRQLIADVCRITHKNDEAYAGALAVVEAINVATKGNWNKDTQLIPLIVDTIPDSRVRDRLQLLEKADSSISAIAEQYGNTGQAADSVPLAIYAAQQIGRLSFEQIFIEIINGGGDTDTTCSMAGQIIGAQIGFEALPAKLMERLGSVKEFPLINSIIEQFAQHTTFIN